MRGCCTAARNFSAHYPALVVQRDACHAFPLNVCASPACKLPRIMPRLEIASASPSTPTTSHQTPEQESAQVPSPASTWKKHGQIRSHYNGHALSHVQSLHLRNHPEPVKNGK